MSDPVSNAEIEDVLSSIRRLVTEDNWQEQDKPAVDAPKVQDRLMLTPALRVKDDTGTNAVDAYVAKQRSRMADAAEPENTPDLVSEATDDAAPVETEANQDEMASPLNNVSFTDQAETPTGSPWTDPVATLFDAAQEGEIGQDDEGGHQIVMTWMKMHKVLRTRRIPVWSWTRKI